MDSPASLDSLASPADPVLPESPESTVLRSDPPAELEPLEDPELPDRTDPLEPLVPMGSLALRGLPVSRVPLDSLDRVELPDPLEGLEDSGRLERVTTVPLRDSLLDIREDPEQRRSENDDKDVDPLTFRVLLHSELYASTGYGNETGTQTERQFTIRTSFGSFSWGDSRGGCGGSCPATSVSSGWLLSGREKVSRVMDWRLRKERREQFRNTPKLCDLQHPSAHSCSLSSASQ